MGYYRDRRLWSEWCLFGLCLAAVLFVVLVALNVRADHRRVCGELMTFATTHDDTLRVRIACSLDGEDALRAVPYDPAVHPKPLDDTLWDR